MLLSHFPMLAAILLPLAAAQLTLPGLPLANITQAAQELALQTEQYVAGVPLALAISVINKLCSNVVATGIIQSQVQPNVSRMHFQLRNNCHRDSFPLLAAEEMWRSPNFDPKKKVVILATGWTTNINNSEAIDAFEKAYNCRGDVNFVALDVARFIDTLYVWSALNTEIIGEYLARGLIHLSHIVPIERVHLIGHSLGAHIVGSAGRHYQELTNSSLRRITGLDPAKPCFNEGEVLSGLLRGDAAFIDIIHSSPGVVGQRGPLGDVDFYPGGLGPIAPGCLALDLDCSHERAWQYFEESIYPGNEDNFLAVRCRSLSSLREGKCPGMAYPMGYSTPMSIKGDYMLDVNSRRPYGQNAGEGSIDVVGTTCGRCE
ncbi:vitellogenin-3-like [Scaptodrosophila lebanonensis]|uniref:Vitellogenin-3-like n=1 Tax=Drosophila lebanonensis TaxID=7225 RepID=A0A6J2UEB6_DROLE|nr:vitellogenin-3-like [Scaptodrosophila lebanonensis]